VRRLALALLAGLLSFAFLPEAFAQDRTLTPTPTPTGEETIQFSTTPPEGKATPSLSEADLNAPPPTRPRHKGFVLEAGLGMLGFAGQFRHVAPPAYWLHTQFGFEPFPWLMVFADGELAFTDTSESQDESHTVAFPLWGFGGGARGTIHVSNRVALYVQGQVGALAAIVPHGALGVIGFRQAESLNLDFGGRLGVEWYQGDRHFALYAAGGPRVAQGFSKLFANGDLPLMWDVGAGLRYTF
jgi:hypothetical protein